MATHYTCMPHGFYFRTKPELYLELAGDECLSLEVLWQLLLQGSHWRAIDHIRVNYACSDTTYYHCPSRKSMRDSRTNNWKLWEDVGLAVQLCS